METGTLRPIERCVVAMSEAGLSSEDIATRINRSPAHVERMMDWIRIPRTRPAPRQSALAFERRVLALRAAGEDHESIAVRFRKSGGFIRRVEGLAHYRKAIHILR